MPFKGGACVAKEIFFNGPENPAHICTFAGTDGSHDTGEFLDYTSCFDRVNNKWIHPFGRLPYGLDHGSIALIPKGTCNPNDPSRLLIFNFRKSNYSTAKSIILAFDIPEQWTEEQLNRSPDKFGEWYIFSYHKTIRP